MGRLVEVVKARFAKRTTAPGKAVLIQTTAGGNIARETELYHPPGISSSPTPKDRAIEIPLISGTRVIVATHNYRLEIPVDPGETVVFSTDSGGGTLKAEVRLDSSGNISLNGDGKRFVTYTELNTAIQNFITALNLLFATKMDTPGAAGTLSLDISAAETSTIRTDG